MKYKFQGIYSELIPSLSWSRNWHTKEDSEILCKYASELKPEETILEVGSAEGQSAITMLLASESVIQIIEPFVTTNLINNIKCMNLDNRVVILPTTSEKAGLALGSVGLLFIDGEHTYDMVKHDLEKFSKANPRFIILHDTNKPELAKAVEEFLTLGTYYREFTGGNITVLSKL
jgi:hypothetical protein